MDRMLNVLEGVYINNNLRKRIVPLFIGNTGLGKTVIVNQFAKSKGVNVVPFITSQRNPFEISGLAMPDKEVKRMSYWDFDTLLEMKDGDILFFDEIFNGNPVTLNACLTILEDRLMISGKKLPKIMIVAAANYQGMVPLTPQIKERFVWYDVKFNPPMWIEFMQNKYQITKTIGNKLARIIKEEQFKTHNFDTPRSIDKAISMILYEVYTPYTDRLIDILSEPITNKLEGEIELSENKELAVNEVITWYDLIMSSGGMNGIEQRKNKTKKHNEIIKK